MRDQLRCPVYANLSHLGNEKKYIGFARDIDAANPSVYIGPEVMVGIFVETAIHLYWEWVRKDKEIELEVKDQILNDVLLQVCGLKILLGYNVGINIHPGDRCRQ
jgi:hypothetical protein